MLFLLEASGDYSHSRKLGNLIPAGSLSASEGKGAINGKWKIPGVAEPVELKRPSCSPMGASIN